MADHRQPDPVVDFTVIHSALEADRERRRMLESQARSESDRTRRYLELSAAAEAFNNWWVDLEYMLNREPTLHEQAERFVTLAAAFRDVIERYLLDHFWRMLELSRWDETDEGLHADACRTLHQLLTAQPPDARVLFLRLFAENSGLTRHILFVLLNGLPGWAWCFRRVLESPDNLTLADLIGLLHMEGVGINLLFEMREDVREFRDAFSAAYLRLTVSHSDLSRVAKAFEQVGQLLTGTAMTRPLTEWRELLLKAATVARGDDRSKRKTGGHPGVPALTADVYAHIRRIAAAADTGSEAKVSKLLMKPENKGVLENVNSILKIAPNTRSGKPRTVIHVIKCAGIKKKAKGK